MGVSLHDEHSLSHASRRESEQPGTGARRGIFGESAGARADNSAEYTASGCAHWCPVLWTHSPTRYLVRSYAYPRAYYAFSVTYSKDMLPCQ